PAGPPPPKPGPGPHAAVHAPRPPVAPPAPAPPIAVQPDPVPPAPAPAAEPAPPAPPAPPQQISNNNLFATVLEATPPRYPLESRRRREEGRVLLRVLVGTDGRVARISVAQSSGHRRLDEAALAAVRKWRWRPTMRDGVGIEQSGVIPIPFVLSGSVRE
ncbi:MAG TPA: energy transducer TonB, partial [Sphingopyxis sp.]|nr:energy transducer TonB [Sphingopyxis sp.]